MNSLPTATEASPAQTTKPATCSLQAPCIRVLTWNIQKQQSPHIHAALSHYATRTDLALLQEARMDPTLLASFGLDWRYSFAHGYSTARRITGVMTLAADDPRRSRQHQALEPLLRTAKATNITHHALNDREHDLLVVNMHAINFSLGTRGYIAQLRSALPELEAHRGPVIFAGDLNTWSSERQAALDSFVTYLGLEEVPFDKDERKRILRRPLDYVFTRGMEVTAADAHHSPCSDHNPLEVALSANSA